MLRREIKLLSCRTGLKINSLKKVNRNRVKKNIKVSKSNVKS